MCCKKSNKAQRTSPLELDGGNVFNVKKMDSLAFKYFCLAIDSIDEKVFPTDLLVKLPRLELLSYVTNERSELLNVYLNDALISMMRESVIYLNEDSKKEHAIVSLIEEIRWNNDAEFVAIKFTSQILPFVLEFKNRLIDYKAS